MSFFTALVTSKIALGALVVSTVAVGGTAAAAYTGSLPGPLQQGAHSLIGAPEPSDSPTATAGPTGAPDPTSTPVGPDATGPAAFGLCTAFSHSGLDVSSTAYASLAKAAGGATQIATYCATIDHPGNADDHGPTATPTPAAPGNAPMDKPSAPQTNNPSSDHRPDTTGRP